MKNLVFPGFLDSALSGSLAAGLIEAIIAVIILFYLNRADTKQAVRP
jgi:hypothetical protein